MGIIRFFNFFVWTSTWETCSGFSSSTKLLLRFASTSDYLKIRKFITYWSLEAVDINKSLIITGRTKWDWITFGAGSLLGFFQRVLPGFLGISWVCEPWLLLLFTIGVVDLAVGLGLEFFGYVLGLVLEIFVLDVAKSLCYLLVRRPVPRMTSQCHWIRVMCMCRPPVHRASGNSTSATPVCHFSNAQQLALCNNDVIYRKTRWRFNTQALMMM